MSVIVQKYGGSSVADLVRIGRVADRVVAARADGHQVVVVVSAMGKTTDQLLAMARDVSATPPRRELDMLLSVGERTTMALLAIALHHRGEDAISFTGSQSGILTNDRHFDARIIEVRPYRIEDELARGRVVIVAGYQGMSYRREITTLGRGGSDTTAVALAAALRADRCEIYSDVDGVYTADPRVVPGARHLPALGYSELQEMAESGAKVLNAEAVAFAKRERIRIHARRTDDVHGSGARETVVSDEVEPSPRRVRAVVGDAQVAWLRGPADLPNALDELLTLAHREGVPLRSVEWTAAGLSAWVSLPRVPDWERAASALSSAGVTVVDPRSVDAVAWVSVVGDGLTEEASVLRDVLSVAHAEGCAPRSVSSSPLRITLAVARESADALTRALHQRFCED
ncbi:MAG: aspartate kinase [Deltaproteobacteria bacterium]|nr:aspartate kinase [Deltaproteobacteria bacterium]